MQLLSVLAALTLMPIFMGDTLQVRQIVLHFVLKRLLGTRRHRIRTAAHSHSRLRSRLDALPCMSPQVFAISTWALTNAQVAQLFAFLSISGVVANVIGGTLIKKLGVSAHARCGRITRRPVKDPCKLPISSGRLRRDHLPGASIPCARSSAPSPRSLLGRLY